MFASLPKNQEKSKNFVIFFDVSGQMLSFNGQPELLTYLRDHPAIFPGFGDGFDTLRMSFEQLGRP